jgi:hypothetical protein
MEGKAYTIAYIKRVYENLFLPTFLRYGDIQYKFFSSHFSHLTCCMHRHVWKYTDVRKSRKKKKIYPQKIYLCYVLFTINIILQLTYYKHKKNIISGF